MEIKGKYNTAKIMINEIDETTYKQIENFVNDESFADTNIVVMPDCHAGSDVCIGFTMTMNDRIIPNLIGVDIGCGILSVKTDLSEINFEMLDNYISNNIPNGFNIHNYVSIKYDTAINYICNILELDEDRTYKSLGTLGGGNHYIECGKGKDNKIWFTVHSGSRNFGFKIAQYYTNKAKEYCDNINYKGIAYLPIQDTKEYIEAHNIAAYYAQLNRKLIIQLLQNYLEFKQLDKIETIHNYIGKDNIIRKGAVSAYDERLIIPFNMRDGMIICKGKSNNEYNYSAPHGAGRILSRSQAKKQLNYNDFVNDMSNNNIYINANQSILDEAPDAYKNMNLIIDNIKPTVEIIEQIKPIYNFKAKE